VQTLARIRELLDQAGHPPKKALGQNFLIDHNLITKLVDASGINASGTDENDTVLEIGPGTGALTEALLDRGARVVAIELDSGLARVLTETLGAEHPDRMTLIVGDCLATKHAINTDAIDALDDQPFALVANLPYHAATPAMMTLMTRHTACTGMFVTIQKEVVDRFLAGPGSKAYGSISVVAQTLGTPERIANLPAECFWPRPGVASAMMAWRRDATPPEIDPVQLASITQTLFQSRRKKLGATVRRLAGREIEYPDAVTPDDRIDALDPPSVAALAAAINAAASPRP